jgi:hypothetical protein
VTNTPKESTEGGASTRGAALGLLAGLGVVALAASSGAARDLLVAITLPPPIVRAALVGGSALGGVRLLALALERMRAAPPLGTSEGREAQLTNRELASMLRGIRFVFLAAAAMTAAAGWLIGEALPIVVAAVIAGVDLAETSLLLLVARRSDAAG